MKKIMSLLLILLLPVFAHATVSSETTRVKYTCNGTSTTYAYPFKILEDDDLLVIKNLTATLADTTLVLNTNYTVTGAGGTGGGNVVLTTGSVCASGYTLTILRNFELTQETDYVDGEVFSAESFENALDKSSMIQQQQSEAIGRSFKLPKTSSLIEPVLPNAVANNYIGWNASGTALEDKAAPVATTATAYVIDALISYGGGTAYTQATIEAALTAIGTVNKVTLLLRPGTWVISSNADWSAYTNVTFKIVPGMLFSRGAFTMNIPNPDAGLYQWLSGTGAVTFSGDVPTLYPQWWGAVGDNSTDSTVALQAFFDAIPSRGQGVIPEGIYKTTALLDIDATDYQNIKFIGYIAPVGCSGIKISNRNYTKIENLMVILSARDWTSDYSGLIIHESNNLDVDIERIDNFQKGLTLSASDAGVAYNKFKINRLQNNKYANYYDITGTGWVNENSFYGGDFTLSAAVKAADTGSYAIYVASTSIYGNNNNRYYSPSFEGLHNGILFDQSTEWLLSHSRFEDVTANHLSGVVVRSVFIFGFGFDISKWGLSVSDARNNVFIGKEANNELTILTEGDYGGFGFLNAVDHTVVGRLYYNSTAPFLAFTPADGVAMALNKGYEGSTTPTTGTYRKGVVVWNSTVAIGQAIGWVCSVSGTAGTLNTGATTATGTLGDAFVVVNSTTGLYAGAQISIVGVAGTKVVTGVSGTTVYLTSTINASVVGAAVAYVNPTWLEIAAQISYRSNAASPAGSVTPLYIGEEYLHTTGNHWFKAHGLTNSDWTALN